MKKINKVAVDSQALRNLENVCNALYRDSMKLLDELAAEETQALLSPRVKIRMEDLNKTALRFQNLVREYDAK